MEWMILPLRRYADFSGRSRRLEYWMFQLFYFLVLIVGVVLVSVIGSLSGDSASSAIFVVAATGFVVGYLALFIPMLAVQVRRLHDQDKSGWFLLLGVIPYLGGLILLILMCIDGTPGPNRFGPDPKDPENDIVDVFA